MGDDRYTPSSHFFAYLFLSTSPVWGTTFPLLGREVSSTNFYPRPPYGGRQRQLDAVADLRKFLSTSPVWGTTGSRCHRRAGCSISIHVPRMGDDVCPFTLTANSVSKFLSTSPVWGTTYGYARVSSRDQFLSTSPVWGTTKVRLARRGHKAFLSTSPVWGTTPARRADCHGQGISIHVPRMGDDPRYGVSAPQTGHFYPRPPYGGRPSSVEAIRAAHEFLSTSPVWGTTQRAELIATAREFLSTSPVWGTTANLSGAVLPDGNFYPRPPYGGRLCSILCATGERVISIHVPRMGDDAQTAPTLGRAINDISIHVPRMGDDLPPAVQVKVYQDFYPRPPYGGRQHCAAVLARRRLYFYPRPPYGGRPDVTTALNAAFQFLSTSPVWGTTQAWASWITGMAISIHVPRMGDDM